MGRNEGLDGVRCIAALLVLLYHAEIPWATRGWVGVDVFFVLSGYFIGRVIVNEFDQTGGFRYGRFLLARLLRLYPALLTVVISLALTHGILFPNTNLLMEVATSLGYVANLTKGPIGQPVAMTHTWSLAAEMQFYLIAPVFIVGLCIVSRWRLARALIAVFVIMALWRGWLQYSGQADWDRIYRSLETRAGTLMLGAAIGVWGVALGSLVSTIFAVGGLVAILLYASGIVGFHVPYALGPAVYMELASAALLIGLLNKDALASRVLSIWPLPLLGLWSYSIYLWHYPIARLVRDSFDPYTAAVITFAISVPLAALTYYFVELRFWKPGSSRRSPKPAPTN